MLTDGGFQRSHSLSFAFPLLALDKKNQVIFFGYNIKLPFSCMRLHDNVLSCFKIVLPEYPSHELLEKLSLDSMG